MKNLVNKTSARMTAAGLAVIAAVCSIAGVAGAAQPTVEETMSTTQASVLQEYGYGAALLIAVMLFVIGIRIVYKWSTKASKQTA